MRRKNIIPCDICNCNTSFERFSMIDPPEGNECARCGSWVCNDCTNYKASGDEGLYCIDCRPRRVYVACPELRGNNRPIDVCVGVCKHYDRCYMIHNMYDRAGWKLMIKNNKKGGK